MKNMGNLAKKVEPGSRKEEKQWERKATTAKEQDLRGSISMLYWAFIVISLPKHASALLCRVAFMPLRMKPIFITQPILPHLYFQLKRCFISLSCHIPPTLSTVPWLWCQHIWFNGRTQRQPSTCACRHTHMGHLQTHEHAQIHQGLV